MVANREGPEVFFEGVQGVAILGASADPGKAGHQIVRNMADAGFPGSIYPVNPHGVAVAGYRGYRSLSSIPARVDLVVVAAPATVVDQVVRDLEERFAKVGDVRGVITAAAGFAETGTAEGRHRQDMLLDVCTRHGVREMGPNCVGIIDNHHHLDTTFIQGTRRRAGGVSMISQSGAFGAWLLSSWSAQPLPAGINKFCSLGNMADLDVIELLAYLGRDERTRVVGMYLEGHPRARELVEVAGEVARRKPVVVLKVGRSEEGGQAARSHTGALTGSDRIYDAAFRQFGVIRVDSADELSDTLQAFDRLPLPGKRVFLATQAGGPGTYCMDVLASFRPLREGGLRAALISPSTRQGLVELLPPFASVCRPEGYCDITAAATVEQHARTVELLLSDPGVDAVLLITVPTLYLPVKELGNALVEAYERATARAGPKPLLSVLLAGDGVRPGRHLLEEAGLPTFETPERAVRALRNLIRYRSFLEDEGRGAA
ncbi:MAG TPA: hypothetical protein GX513_02720 [Firmicutes bacterium]|nr:hypothetical protein [Bacillota bacterium]